LRTWLVTATLVVVLAASALNLMLGAFWVAALLVVMLLRRRVRFAAGLILLLAIGAGVAGIRLGWFAPPPPTSYAVDEAGWLLERLPFGRAPAAAMGRADESAGATPGAALRARLQERRQEEFRYTGADVERRAAAAVALSRGLRPLRAQAPGEVAELEEAVRRLALTLTSPEFRDLEGRRSRLQTWFTELEARLAAARDESEVDGVAQALDPAAMATVSLGALHEDLARVDVAATALIRALTGRDVSVTATSAMRYDEHGGQLVVEDRYVFVVEPPLRIVRLDVGALRQGAPGQGLVRTLGYEVAGAAPREVGGSGEIRLATGVARVVVVDGHGRPAAPASLHSLLKRIGFGRVAVDRGGRLPGEVLITVALDGGGTLEALLPLRIPEPRLERITAPRHALHYVSLPGTITTTEAQDVWVPAKPEGTDRATGLVVEVVPATVLFRNGGFARLKDYLYRPNLAATLTLTGLAALTGVLVRRRRGAGPPAPG